MKRDGGETKVTRKEPVYYMPVLVGGRCASKILQSSVLVRENNTPFCRKNTRVSVRLIATETRKYGQERIRVSPTQMVAHLHCI